MITVTEHDRPLLMSYCEDMIEYFEHKSMGDSPEKQVYVLALSFLSGHENNNKTWPTEVLLLAQNIEDLSQLSNSQRNKVLAHINRMLLEKMPADEISAAAKFLAVRFGEVRQ